MGLSGISISQLLLILAIVLLIFGSKRLKNLGGDLGDALKGFRRAMQEHDAADTTDEKIKSSTKAEKPKD